MEKRDLYEVLGVTRTQSADEIKKAYRRLAREHHPDVNPGDAKAEERFKEISYAKEILLDDAKRKLYDEFGLEGLAAGFDPEQGRAYREWSDRAAKSPSGGFSAAGDLDELLAQMFGAQGRPGGADSGFSWGFDPAQQPGFDLESELEIDFMDSVLGGEVRMKVGRPDGASGESKTLRVNIPVGATDGSRIRLAGQGVASVPDGKAGDLFVRLRVRPHAFYERRGDDLHIDLPVTLPEAILGAEIKVPTPAGPVDMKVPPGSANGRRLRLRGKGVARDKGKPGDLFVQLVLTLPEAGDERLDEIARQLEPLYEEKDVRAALHREVRK